jgi:hypothetical protein
MGRRSHVPAPQDRRQVEAMAAYGVPEADIARVLAIDPKTLRKHYRDELDTGAVKATAKVAEFLFRRATTEGPQAVTAAIFWLKARAGWKETQIQETKNELIVIERKIVHPRHDAEGRLLPPLVEEIA